MGGSTFNQYEKLIPEASGVGNPVKVNDPSDPVVFSNPPPRGVESQIFALATPVVPSSFVTLPDIYPDPPLSSGNGIEVNGPSMVFPVESFVVIETVCPPLLFVQSMVLDAPLTIFFSSKFR